MKGTRLFFVHCQGDGSWLTTREPKGRVFAHNPPDPMLVTGPVAHAEWQGAYNLVPTPWTAEAWPDFQNQGEPKPVTIYIQDGLVQHVQAGADQSVTVIDLDTEGTPDRDLQPLTGGEILAMPEGLTARRGRGFIRVWQNGEAVPRE